MFCLKTSVQVNGDGRSLPVQHLVVTTWAVTCSPWGSETTQWYRDYWIRHEIRIRFILNQPGFPIGDVNVRVLFTLLPCQGAAAAAMWAAWGKGGGGDGEDARGRWDLLVGIYHPPPPPHPKKKYMQLSEKIIKKIEDDHGGIHRFDHHPGGYGAGLGSANVLIGTVKSYSAVKGFGLGLPKFAPGKWWVSWDFPKNGMDGYHVSIGIPRMDPWNF